MCQEIKFKEIQHLFGVRATMVMFIVVLIFLAYNIYGAYMAARTMHYIRMTMAGLIIFLLLFVKLNITLCDSNRLILAVSPFGSLFRRTLTLNDKVKLERLKMKKPLLERGYRIGDGRVGYIFSGTELSKIGDVVFTIDNFDELDRSVSQIFESQNSL